ncbi:MAG: hypothetical protein AAF646_14040 [Pseudomonadota bacterium]
MKLRYERPLPDLRFLIQAPLRLELENGSVAQIERWCPEGFQPPDRLNGDSGAARLIVPFHGFDIRFPVLLERDHEANLMRFVDLGPREERLLKHFYREIVTGRAVSDDLIIAAMDTPVDRVPMTRTGDEKDDVPSPSVPRAVRALTVMVLYLILAVLVYEPLIQPIVSAMSALLGEPAPAAFAPGAHPTLGPGGVGGAALTPSGATSATPPISTPKASEPLPRALETALSDVGFELFGASEVRLPAYIAPLPFDIPPSSAR